MDNMDNMDNGDQQVPGAEEPEWEFDDRRLNVVKNVLIAGEELAWVSKKENEFDGVSVYKTLRKLAGGDVTFLVETFPHRSRVLTVGTICDI